MHAWDPAARAPAIGAPRMPGPPRSPVPSRRRPPRAASRSPSCTSRRPDSPVLSFLRRVHERHRHDASGAVATYIPELARADPPRSGSCVATVDGAVYEVGDTRAPFTIQSMSKPLVYAARSTRRGTAAVRARIGVEPTGDAFNAISLEAGTGMPLNPMVNAGAITAGLMPETTAARPASPARGSWLLGRFAGRDLDLDESVYRLGAGHRPPQPGDRPPPARHRRLAGDPDGVVDAYFKLAPCR